MQIDSSSSILCYCQMSWISIALYSLFVVGHAYIFLDVFSGMESVDDETDI